MAFGTVSALATAVSSPLTITKPTSTADGDVLIAFMSVDSSSSTFTAPAGWTAHTSNPLTSTADGQRFYSFYKVASGEGANYAFTITGSVGSAAGAIIRFTGRSATPITDQNSGSSNTASGSPRTITSTGVTAASGDDLVIGMMLDTTASLTPSYTPPSGYTEALDAGDGTLSSLSIAYKENVSSGATGSVSGTGTYASGNAGYAAFLYALASASGGGTTGTALPGVGAITTSGLAPSMNPFTKVFIREVLINEAGSPVANRTGMTLMVWYQGFPGGSPDLSYSALTTDAAGTASWSLLPGTLAYGQNIFYLATDGSTSLSMYTCGRLIPNYQ